MIPSYRSHRKTFLRHSAPLLVCTIMATFLGLVGCDKAESESRYDLSGKITHGGKAIPTGYISFVPDKEKGNQGPGASASIVDGQYKTLPGEGTVGGPHIVTIVGSDGIPIEYGEGIPPNPAGHPLFPKYEISIDLPNQVDTHNIDVPASHGQDEAALQKQSESADQGQDGSANEN
jgi:hypothetical protein